MGELILHASHYQDRGDEGGPCPYASYHELVLEIDGLSVVEAALFALPLAQYADPDISDCVAANSRPRGSGSPIHSRSRGSRWSGFVPLFRRCDSLVIFPRLLCRSGPGSLLGLGTLLA